MDERQALRVPRGGLNTTGGRWLGAAARRSAMSATAAAAAAGARVSRISNAAATPTPPPTYHPYTLTPVQ